MKKHGLYSELPRNREARRWRKKNPDKVFGIDLWRRYKITIETYYKILKKQRGRCAICKSKDPKRRNVRANRFHVDHDHKTKRVRGLLCFICNLGLGSFKDNPKLLKNAQLYLQRK
jgi:hypothetical protein